MASIYPKFHKPLHIHREIVYQNIKLLNNHKAHVQITSNPTGQLSVIIFCLKNVKHKSQTWN